MRRMLLLTALLGSCLATTYGQQEHTVGTMPPGDNVVGKVTAMTKDSLTIVPLMGGAPVTIKIGEATRIMRERQPVKLEAIKADETVFARGKLNGNVLEA